MGDLGLDKAKVIQCALSRVCGVCGECLARPVAFLGSAEEAARMSLPLPAHPRRLRRARAGDVGPGVERRARPVPDPEGWVLVTTSGFEFVRMGSDALDKRPVFIAELVSLEERRLTL